MKLEELLSPELYAQVNAAIEAYNSKQADKSKYVRFADLSEGGYVSVDKYNDKVNGLTEQINGLNQTIAQRDSDMTALNDKLTAAQGDAAKYAEMQTSLTQLQQKYADEKTAWEQKISKQAYEYNIRERAGLIKFTSAAAKRDFISQAVQKGFKQDGDKLEGYDDFVKTYKEENKGAVVEDDGDNNGQPAVVIPPKNNPSGDPKTPFVFKFNGVRAHD